jgi:Holliday junction resolvase RusA-like endonuclease
MTEHREPGQILAQVWVPGRPRTKGSLKFWCTRGRDHKVRVEEQVADSGKWRKHVATLIQQVQLREYGNLLKLDAPVEVRTVYFFQRDQEDMSDQPYPVAITTGDLDKLDRNVGDALTMSGLIKDDKLIVHGPRGKFWAAQAGAQIMVLRASTESAEVEAYAKHMLRHAGGLTA